MLVSASPTPLNLRLLRAAALVAALAAGPLAARAADSVDLGQKVPEAQTINEGLFPEDACKELEQAGYKCMGFKPAVRFSLPTATFRLGSADLPDMLRQQLDRFAEVLRGKRGSPHVVRIEGHADATGSDDINGPLSQKRAEAVRDYLVKNGADPGMLKAVGMGSKAPKVANDPAAAENRRVEIGRQGAN
ncbi:MAG TPA: OmpA family protein [Aquabacterium sp.]|nr:OmpA family protein [Aquabacterium sp.]HQC99115.1 OmpA family protein [Aquabacterium sp.]